MVTNNITEIKDNIDIEDIKDKLNAIYRTEEYLYEKYNYIIYDILIKTGNEINEDNVRKLFKAMKEAIYTFNIDKVKQQKFSIYLENFLTKALMKGN